LFLEEDLQTLRAVNRGIEAWRYGKLGALSCFYPDATEALGSLILIVDDEVAAFQADLTRARTGDP